eukprot:5868580-Pyramimonas_sp.AAC.1
MASAAHDPAMCSPTGRPLARSMVAHWNSRASCSSVPRPEGVADVVERVFYLLEAFDWQMALVLACLRTFCLSNRKDKRRGHLGNEKGDHACPGARQNLMRSESMSPARGVDNETAWLSLRTD